MNMCATRCPGIHIQSPEPYDDGLRTRLCSGRAARDLEHGVQDLDALVRAPDLRAARAARDPRSGARRGRATARRACWFVRSWTERQRCVSVHWQGAEVERA